MKKKNLAAWVIWLFFSVLPVWSQETISPGDKIHIWVKGEPELTVDRIVESDGCISFPLIGTVGVAGLTTGEAAKVIAKMLDDGYLRNPLVQVDFVKKDRKSEQTKQAAKVVGYPLQDSEKLHAISSSLQHNTKIKKPIQIEILDKITKKPVANAALLVGGKIYQSNRRGQMLIEVSEGPAILIADGYKVVQDNLEKIFAPDFRKIIFLEPIPLAAEIPIKVVDMASGKPLANVEITLNSVKAKTNSQGTFRIRDVKTEYGEIQLSKKGYKTIRRIIDFKDPSERIISMIREDR